MRNESTAPPAIAPGHAPRAASALRPCLFFALQQSLIFASAVVFLRAVRWLTGHTLHGAVDAVGPVEAIGVLLMYGLHLGLTVWLFRRAKGPLAGPLGLAWSPRRGADFVLGAGLAFALCGWPWLVALATGEAHIADTLARQGASVHAAQIAFWLGALVVNSLVEEAASRAFPMRLWAGRGLWLRAFVPSLLFAALHLADEPFRAGAFASRTLAGLSFSLAYAATGSIWLGAGLHTGVNYAIIWRQGSWHAGSLVKVEGRPVLSDELVSIACGLLAVGAYLLWRRTKSGQKAAEEGDS